MNRPDFRHLQQSMEDVTAAALDQNTGPLDPVEYHSLQERLHDAASSLPPLYREHVYHPFMQAMDKLTEAGFTSMMRRDPRKEREAGLFCDIAQAILQNKEGYEKEATDAFQEVVSDLYDGFLSEEDRKGIKPPDQSLIAPLVKWGRPHFGPYTWTVEAASHFGIKTGIVNLPPANAHHGLLAWSALGHETAGHDILHADIGLLGELQKTVYDALWTELDNRAIADYWSLRIDETASDVLGILNTGPAAGIGLIGYFRGLNQAYKGKAILRNTGPEADPHPADILRGYLAAETVRLLHFDYAEDWASALQEETDKDLTSITLGRASVDVELIKQSAAIVAQAITQTRLMSLEGHAFGDIQNWHNHDERIVQEIRAHLESSVDVQDCIVSGMYAAHVVSAAVTGAIAGEVSVREAFTGMTSLLKSMHDANPSWGPLYVRHRGDLTLHRIYSRTAS
ncbi:hypothetical protein BRE01_00350 [Brevibacillus reuszeri]|uniref:Uncharacterized protein n=1 Tax=Brevibacillus reuszeri TaxID=54915 RepID=A0A0K9YRX6_9BACL|nr:hypothetical protein [Brevibacillus reuszeri]KNB71382.1 hypothetical protein ADS79_21525 [Brevibacillus reuszeri]MED1857836.1 hypothetical protein [Brevibacillus reuszeri]GED66333.1 hypothetical protein BRE01_00350 [Brevibacillus reuszeri]